MAHAGVGRGANTVATSDTPDRHEQHRVRAEEASHASSSSSGGEKKLPNISDAAARSPGEPLGHSVGGARRQRHDGQLRVDAGDEGTTLPSAT